MSTAGRRAVWIAAAAAGVVAVAVVQFSARGEQRLIEPTNEQRALVAAVLAQEKPPEQVNWDLMQLLVNEEVAVRRLAAGELRGRDLSEAHVKFLEGIVHEVPFVGQEGCVVTLVWPGMNVGSREAWETLAHFRTHGRPVDEQVEWYITQLRYDRPFGPSRGDAAAHRLGEVGAPAVPALTRATEREGSWAQLWAARTLMQIGTDEAKAAAEAWALATLEATDGPLIWWAAANWLGRLESQAAFQPLERMLWAQLASGQAWALIDSLGKIDPERAREPLGRILAEHEPDADHPDLIEPYLRAASTLARLGDERGWEALEDAIDSPLVEMRRELASAAFATHDARAREVLRQLSEDENERVASSGEYCLKELERAIEQEENQQE